MSVRLLPRSIRGIAIVIALAAGLITALLGLATYALVHHEIERQIDHRIEIETRALLAYHEAHGFTELANMIRARDSQTSIGATGYLAGVDDEDRSMGYILTDASGRRRAGSLAAAMPPAGWSEFVHFGKPDGTTGIAQAMNSAIPGGGRLVVAADRAVVDQMDLKILKLFLLDFGLIIIVVGLVAFGLARIIHVRLEGIRTAAQAIMAGNLTTRMHVNGGGGELDRLAMALNAMLDRIDTLVKHLRHISVGIAHDLRTPINRMRVRLEEALRSADPDFPETLSAAIADSDELMELLSGLLAISELEGRAVRSRFTAVDLNDAIEEIVAAYQPSLDECGVTISTCLAAPVILGERRLLQRCIANLLDNARVHTPAGTHVEIVARAEDGAAVIHVSDTGPGVPPEEAERVFEPMVRLEQSRSAPGHGLGLSIVAAIIAAHDGTVEIASRQTGMLMIIRLPGAAAGISRPDLVDPPPPSQIV